MTTRRKFLTWLGLAPVAAIVPQQAQGAAIDWVAGLAPSDVNDSARRMMVKTAMERDRMRALKLLAELNGWRS